MSKDKKTLKRGRVEGKKPKKISKCRAERFFGLKFEFVYSALKRVFKIRFRRIEW